MLDDIYDVYPYLDELTKKIVAAIEQRVKETQDVDIWGNVSRPEMFRVGLRAVIPIVKKCREEYRG